MPGAVGNCGGGDADDAAGEEAVEHGKDDDARVGGHADPAEGHDGGDDAYGREHVVRPDFVCDDARD